MTPFLAIEAPNVKRSGTAVGLPDGVGGVVLAPPEPRP